MEAYAGFEPEVGEIRALRTFRIGPGGVLYPLFSDLAWVDGVNTARCRVPVPTGQEYPTEQQQRYGAAHVAPEPDCTCGYYAYATETGAAESPRTRHVLAVVACSGRVIAGTRGIRAEHARVEALWMSGEVPDELAARVSSRYRSTATYPDKSTMPAEHPATPLDCYEVEAHRHRASRSLAVRLAILSALVIGLLPANWIWQHHGARLFWAAELCLCLLGAAVLRLTRRGRPARGGALLLAAMVLWLIAAFAGAAGILLLRLPIIQIALLGWIHRAHLNREARRFPARIGPTAR
jgi:hypothetical protein